MHHDDGGPSRVGRRGQAERELGGVPRWRLGPTFQKLEGTIALARLEARWVRRNRVSIYIECLCWNAPPCALNALMRSLSPDLNSDGGSPHLHLKENR